MKNKKQNNHQIIIIAAGVIFFILAFFTAYKAVQNSQTTSNSADQKNSKQTQDNPIDINIPPAIVSVNAGQESPASSGQTITILCQGSLSYNCNVQIVAANNSSQVINFDTQPIVDNGQGLAATSWKWPAESGKWVINSWLSDSNGNKGRTAPLNIEVQ